jgi:hypothetical protein
MGGLILALQYFVVLPVFAFAAKRQSRRELRGWTDARGRGHTFTGQYG